MVLRWMLPGFNQPNNLGRGRASNRNLLGSKNGTANLSSVDARLMDELVWVGTGDDEPAWTVGGSYLRGADHPDAGRVLGPDAAADTGDDHRSGQGLRRAARRHAGDRRARFHGRPERRRVRLDGHIRLANPRTAATEKNRILRRGFSYSVGFDPSGHFDQGLLFQCFQRDLGAGFLTVQDRLSGEALEEYITPVGGGFFFALPGVEHSADWYGRSLLS